MRGEEELGGSPKTLFEGVDEGLWTMRKSWEGVPKASLQGRGNVPGWGTMHGDEGMWVMRKSWEGAPRFHLQERGVRLQSGVPLAW